MEVEVTAADSSLVAKESTGEVVAFAKRTKREADSSIAEGESEEIQRANETRIEREREQRERVQEADIQRLPQQEGSTTNREGKEGTL
jgi:hypothetical protein